MLKSVLICSKDFKETETNRPVRYDRPLEVHSIRPIHLICAGRSGFNARGVFFLEYRCHSTCVLLLKTKHLCPATTNCYRPQTSPERIKRFRCAIAMSLLFYRWGPCILHVTSLSIILQWLMQRKQGLEETTEHKSQETAKRLRISCKELEMIDVL